MLTQKVRKHVSRHAKRVGKHLKNHFIPHEGNNHHPHLLRHGALLVYSFFLIAIKVVAVVLPIALPSSSLFSSAITVRNIADLTNAARANVGLAPLVLNDRLLKAAQGKADDMLKNQYFAHQSPSGEWPWNWIRGNGYDYSYAGENLAVHFLEAEDVQAGWLASPTHRANIVNTHYTETGIGIASGMFENAPSVFVVQFFGTPLPPAQGPATPSSEPLLASAEPAPGATPPSETEPVATPVTETAQVAGIESPPPPSSPAIQTTTVKPTANGVELTVQTQNVKSVTAQLGTMGQSLNQTNVGAKQTWEGTLALAPETSSPDGDPLNVTVQTRDGKTHTETVVLVAPEAEAKDVFLFNDRGERSFKLFGLITVKQLQDGVRRTYIYFIIFLSALLLLNVFIKIRIQHPTVLVHGLAVLGLASVLLFL